MYDTGYNSILVLRVVKHCLLSASWGLGVFPRYWTYLWTADIDIYLAVPLSGHNVLAVRAILHKGMPRSINQINSYCPRTVWPRFTVTFICSSLCKSPDDWGFIAHRLCVFCWMATFPVGVNIYYTHSSHITFSTLGLCLSVFCQKPQNVQIGTLYIYIYLIYNIRWHKSSSFFPFGPGERRSRPVHI